MNINSPTAIPSSEHEEMKEQQYTFWYLFLLKTQGWSSVLVHWALLERIGAPRGPLVPGLLIRLKYARLSQLRIN